MKRDDDNTAPSAPAKEYYHSKKDRIFVRGIQGAYDLSTELARLRAMPRVRKARELKFVDGPQTYSRHYVEPKDGITQNFHLHLEEYGPGGKSQKHGHVNEAAFYILDGEGYEIHDDVRYDWKAGDVAIVHNNCVHQHFNASPDKPARALVIKTKPMFMFMNMLFQKTVEPRPRTPAPGGENFEAREEEDDFNHPEGRLLRWHGRKPARGSTASANENLYQRLLDDAETAPTRNAGRRKLIHPAEMPWEMSRQGLLKHLINEAMNTRMETVDAYMQIIPPGSRSGKHRHLAEECLYVLEGRGYDLHQDCDVEITDTYHWKPQEEIKRFEWEAGDVIYVPPNTIHQHFNADAERPARLISSINRIFKHCGLNDLEQIEDAPGVRARPHLDAGACTPVPARRAKAPLTCLARRSRCFRPPASGSTTPRFAAAY